jgi:hypothetical protein
VVVVLMLLLVLLLLLVISSVMRTDRFQSCPLLISQLPAVCII